MIEFREMTEKDFEAYAPYFVSDYAKDVEKEYRMSPKDALQFAEKTMNSYLTEGLSTPGHFLLNLRDRNTQVGVLWYFRTADSFFIMDLSIYEPFRSKGYGTKTLEMLEKKAREKGKRKIELYVFCSNTKAMNLYKKLQFRPVRLYMEKMLD